MVQRVTVTISDSLGKRLQAVKGKIENISKLCQDAIDREVTRQELLLKGSDNMNNVIERLRLEKEEYSEQYKEQGQKKGYSDAKSMSYDNLMILINEPKSFYETKIWDNLQDEIKDLSEEDAAFDDNAWLEGWQEGVKLFWEEIKDQL